MKIATALAGTALLVMSTVAYAAPCATGTTVSGDKNASKSSTVDPGATANTSPGAKTESPGTVGAMNSAGSTAATSPADVKKQDEGKKTASQEAKGNC